jgi:chromosome segregation ATPase
MLQVLGELMGDQSLEKFRLEYEKLHRALKKSHEQEKRLVKKCRELNSEILNNQAKIKTALRLSQEDQKTIAHLQKEMEKTWKLVYLSQDKENRAKDTIAALKEEMTNLSKLVERGAGLSVNQENLVKELKQAKDELQRQVEEQKTLLDRLDRQLEEQHSVQEELRAERDEANRTVEEVRERLAVKESDNLREIKRREKTQKELLDARVKLDTCAKTEDRLKVDIQKGKDAQTELERQLADARTTMDKYLKDYDSLHDRTVKVTEDLDSQVTRNKQLHADFAALDKEMNLKRIEISRINTEKSVLERKLDKEHRAALHYQQAVEDAKTPLMVAHAEIENLNNDILATRRHELQLSREVEKVAKDKESQLAATERAEQKAKDNLEVVNEKARVVNSLASEVSDQKQEIQHLRKAIYQLEKDRERLSNEVTNQRTSFLSTQEELKLRDVQILELTRRSTEWEAKLRQQQQLYEGVRADRNHYSKGLIEAQDEIAELRKKFKIMGHQIEQLKDEVSSKDQAIVKVHYEFQKAEKIKENLQNELNKLNLHVKSNHELIEQQDNELKKLTTALKHMDEESLAQRKEYDHIINERDILGMQLIRRNDELALLYEKLKVQRSALRHGEAQYTARMDDLRLLRIKVQDLVRENRLYSGSGDQISELKKEILHIQRELLQEKTKVTALSEELENPMNVHRWRKLEGSDPATFELIQKIQTLQRRLISKTEEVVEKGLIIQEKDKLYTELKSILARQPGPEVAEQLNVYQQNLKKKSSQMKAMASEVNMYQAQVNEFKYELERSNRELMDMKKKFYENKRKEQLAREIEDEAGGAFASTNSQLQTSNGNGTMMSKTAPAQVLLNQQAIAAKSARTRFAGGGFAIK